MGGAKCIRHAFCSGQDAENWNACSFVLLAWLIPLLVEQKAQQSLGYPHDREYQKEQRAFIVYVSAIAGRDFPMKRWISQSLKQFVRQEIGSLPRDTSCKDLIHGQVTGLSD